MSLLINTIVLLLDYRKFILGFLLLLSLNYEEIYVN